MIDDMDMVLKGFNETVTKTSTACVLSTDMERLRALKKDIIDQAIVTSSKMIDNLNLIIQSEQNKFSVKNRYMESTSEWQKSVFNAIENRRRHMIQRANFMIKHKLRTSRNTRNNTQNENISLHD